MRAFWIVVRHELRLVAADPLGTGLLAALTAVLIGYGAFTGAAWVGERDAAIRTVLDEAAARRDGQIEAAAKRARGDQRAADEGYTGSAGEVGARAALPTRALAAVSIRAGELQPFMARVYLLADTFNILDDYRSPIMNPAVLATGRCDLAFVLVNVLPLLMIAFAFNMLSGEREQGTLILVLSQPIGLTALSAGKALARGGLFLVTACLLLLPALLAACPVSADVALLEGLWLGYGCFWIALILLVNAAGWSSARNALVLSFLWVGLVIVVPSAVSLAADAVYPLPSRGALTNEMRETVETESERSDRILGDSLLQHPEASPATTGADAAARSLAVREHVDRVLGPVVADFEERLAARRRFASALRFASPAIAMQTALDRIAGTDAERTQRFVAATRAYLSSFRDRLRPMAVRGALLTEQDYRSLPVFDFQPFERSQPDAEDVEDALFFLALALGLTLAARPLLRRYQITRR